MGTYAVPDYPLDRKAFDKCTSRRFAAAEIEVAGLGANCSAKPINETAAAWRCSLVHDGSLPPEGFEINTAPAIGGALYTQIHELGAALTKCKAFTTSACGLHAHIDSRDFHFQDIRRLVRAYASIEPLIFATIHPSRAKNKFCAKCGPIYVDQILLGIKPENKEVKKAIIETTYGIGSSVARKNGAYYGGKHAYTPPPYMTHINHQRAGNRRYAMNIHSWFLRGTIEYRMHHGTVDGREILSWLQLLTDLHDRVNELSDKDIDAICSSTSVTERAQMNELLGVDLSMRSAVLHGAVVAKRLLSPESLQWFIDNYAIYKDPANISAERNFGTAGPAARWVDPSPGR